MMTLSYAHEKLAASVWILAVGAGPVRSRLWDAWSSQMSHLSMMDASEAVPSEILERLRRLEERANDRGSYQHTFDTMAQDDAVQMARDLVELSYDVTELFRELGPLV